MLLFPVPLFCHGLLEEDNANKLRTANNNSQ
jgi:hypothetical protein